MSSDGSIPEERSVRLSGGGMKVLIAQADADALFTGVMRAVTGRLTPEQIWNCAWHFEIIARSDLLSALGFGEDTRARLALCAEALYGLLRGHAGGDAYP